MPEVAVSMETLHREMLRLGLTERDAQHLCNGIEALNKKTVARAVCDESIWLGKQYNALMDCYNEAMGALGAYSRCAVESRRLQHERAMVDASPPAKPSPTAAVSPSPSEDR